MKVSRNVFGLMMLAFLLLLSGCGRNAKNDSLEYRDYAISMTVEMDEHASYIFTFNLVDLTDYKGTTRSFLNTTECSLKADTLENAMEKYRNEKIQEIDLGHLEEMTFVGNDICENYYDLIMEISAMPEIPKSVVVNIVQSGGRAVTSDATMKKTMEIISLRDLIKETYEWEESNKDNNNKER